MSRAWPVALVVLLAIGHLAGDAPTSAGRESVWQGAVAMAVAPPAVVQPMTPRPEPQFTPLFDRLVPLPRATTLSGRGAARLRPRLRRKAPRRVAVASLSPEQPDDH